MLNRLLNRTEPIGCHVGPGHLRLAQVQGLSSGRPRTVVAERELPHLPETHPAYDGAVADLLRNMFRAAPFRGARTVSCLPAGSMKYRTMRLAPMPDAELVQAAHWKAASELGMKTEAFKSAVLNFGTIREGGKSKTEALVLGAAVEHLDRHVATLVAAGLQPVAVDASVCAVARCLGTAGLADEQGPAQRVVLELREDAAFLAVVAGTELAFVRPLGEGLSQLDRMLGDLLEVPPAEAHVLYATAASARAAAAGDAEVTAPAHWPSAVPFARVRDAIADASRVYGRELARQVALSLHYYSTTFAAAAPEAGTVVAERAVDHAALEAVTVQSGVDFTAFDGTAAEPWAQVRAAAAAAGSDDVGAWVTALGLSLYEQGLPRTKEAA